MNKRIAELEAEVKELQSQNSSDKKCFEKMTSIKIKSTRLQNLFLEASTLYEENEMDKYDNTRIESDIVDGTVYTDN